MEKKRKVIFFCFIETINSKHDRQSLNEYSIYKKDDEIREEFYHWIQEQRKIVEKEKKLDAIIVSINLIM